MLWTSKPSEISEKIPGENLKKNVNENNKRILERFLKESMKEKFMEESL